MTAVEQETGWPLPLGISAQTGRPLSGLSASALADLPDTDPRVAERADAPQGMNQGDEIDFAVSGGTDPNDLAQAGWGVILAPGTAPEIKEALKPLLEHRRNQTGDLLYKVFEMADAPQPGESAEAWLARYRLTLSVVIPELGVPYYLLLVASPQQISFEFQYTLDLYWAVGRVCFDTPAHYAQYAKSVIEYESVTKPAQARRIGLFTPAHPFDKATQLLGREVATPLLDGFRGLKPVGERQKFARHPLVGSDATKQNLTALLQGGTEKESLAVLFSGSHGMEFTATDRRVRDAQGAIVCQDWGGYGAIGEADWFAASDLPADARIHGLIHFLFACYGGGCPEFDNFQRDLPAPRRLAPSAMLATLPQALLTHPGGGALAVIGHVDRAWAYSFYSQAAGGQSQVFADVLSRLCSGDRVGQAMDVFNLNWATRSTGLSDTLDRRSRREPVSDVELARAWVARDDARNYVVLGDPATRLRVEDLAPIL